MSVLELLFEPRTLEDPTTSLADPVEWLWDALGAEKSSSGIRVSQKSVLGYPAVWRAISLVSGDVAKLPLIVYQRVGGGKERATKHPAYNLLRYRPNEYQTVHDWRRAEQIRIMLRGNSYSYIERDGSARPIALLPLNAATTYPVRQNGVLWYIVRTGTETRKLRSWEVLHIRGPGDGLEGWSVLSCARESLGLGLAARKYGSIFFKHGAKPNVVLEHPNRLGKEAKDYLRKSWNKIHEGLDNAHKTAILEEGMKLHEFSISNEDAQFLQTRQFEIREVANLFGGVPPHKLGDTTRTAFASLEQENQSYLSDCLDSYLSAWEAECREKLLTEEEKRADSHVVEFLRQALIRADIKARAVFYRSALHSGWMNRDEIRTRENMNEIPGGAGKKFYIPQNLAVLEPDGSITPVSGKSAKGETKSATADKQADLVKLHREILSVILGRMMRRIEIHIEKAKRDGVLEEFLDGRMEDDHRATVLEAIGPSISLARAGGLADVTAEDMADRLFARLRSPDGHDSIPSILAADAIRGDE